MKTPAKKKADSAIPSSIDAILIAAAKLSPEDRAEASRLGLVLPVSGGEGSPTETKYGYRCRHCNELALSFLGTSFIDASGNEVSTPPSNVPCTQIPWTQTIPAGEIVRHAPKCQHCGQHVILNNGQFFRPTLVVDIDLWQSSRLNANVRPKKRVSGGSVPGVDSAWIAPKNVGDLIDPQARARMTEMAAQHNLDSISVDI